MAKKIAQEKPPLLTWGAGKPVGMVLIARTFGLGAPDMYEWLKLLHERKAGKSLWKVPQLEGWLKYYRDHRKLQADCLAAVRREFPKMADRAEVALAAGEFLAWFGRQSPEFRRKAMESTDEGELLQGAVQGRRLSRLLLRAQNREILQRTEEKGNDQEDAKWKRVIRSDAMQFFMSVWIPCMWCCGTYPTLLMYRARKGGGGEHVANLLRLDKNALFDSKIGEYVRRNALENPEHFYSLGKAFAEPVHKLTLKRVKLRAGGLTSALAIGVDAKGREIRMTSVEIEKVLTGAPRPKGDSENEPDIGETRKGATNPEAVMKGIQREKQEIQEILHPWRGGQK